MGAEAWDTNLVEGVNRFSTQLYSGGGIASGLSDEEDARFLDSKSAAEESKGVGGGA